MIITSDYFTFYIKNAQGQLVEFKTYQATDNGCTTQIHIDETEMLQMQTRYDILNRCGNEFIANKWTNDIVLATPNDIVLKMNKLTTTSTLLTMALILVVPPVIFMLVLCLFTDETITNTFKTVKVVSAMMVFLIAGAYIKRLLLYKPFVKQWNNQKLTLIPKN